MRAISKTVLLFLLFCTLLWNCGTACSGFYIPKSQQAVNNLLHRSASSLQQKYQLRPIGTAVSMPGAIVRTLGLSFQIQGPLTKSELRLILVQAAHELLAEINGDPNLRPYLKHHPFDIGDVEIVLFIIDERNHGLRAPHLTMARIDHEELSYQSWVGVEIPRVSSRTEESYREALGILQRENPKGLN